MTIEDSVAGFLNEKIERFRTEKGSLYEIQSDGIILRNNKAIGRGVFISSREYQALLSLERSRKPEAYNQRISQENHTGEDGVLLIKRELPGKEIYSFSSPATRIEEDENEDDDE